MSPHKNPEIIIYFCECALHGLMLMDIERLIAGKFGIELTRRKLGQVKLESERILKAPSNFRHWFREADALRVNLDKYKEENSRV